MNTKSSPNCSSSFRPVTSLQRLALTALPVIPSLPAWLNSTGEESLNALHSAEAEVITCLCILLGMALVLGGTALLLLIRSLASHLSASLVALDMAEHDQPAPSLPMQEPQPVKGRTPISAGPNALEALPGTIKPNAELESTPTGRSTSKGSCRQFKFIFAQQLLPAIHRYVTTFLQRNGVEKEAGGMLVGDYSFDRETSTATLQVSGFIEAGPKADASSGSIQFDLDFQQQSLCAIQLEHPQAINIGCIHRHPGSLDVCSAGDAATDREAVQSSDTKALVFAIITLGNHRHRPSSIVYRDFKVDFYLMAAETGFEYVPLKPTLAELPLLEPSIALRALLTSRGLISVHDLALLRRLPGFGKTQFSSIDAEAGAALLLTTGLTGSPANLLVWAHPEGALRLFHDDGNGQRQELSGPWSQAEVGRHVWLSHLLLLAQNRLKGEFSGIGYGCHCGRLLENRHRLVAEVRAMQERYGNRAVLRQRGTTLCWEYMIHESGRQFPIEIHYPETFPAEPPRILSVKRLPPSPHQLGHHELCWIDAYSGHSEWNPARDTAVICVNAAHRWFACLLVYLSTGRWPKGADD